MAECMPWLHREETPGELTVMAKTIAHEGITLDIYDALYDMFGSRKSANAFLVKVLRRIIATLNMPREMKNVCLLTLIRSILAWLKHNPYASWPTNVQHQEEPMDAWQCALQTYNHKLRKNDMANLLIHLRAYVNQK